MRRTQQSQSSPCGIALLAAEGIPSTIHVVRWITTAVAESIEDSSSCHVPTTVVTPATLHRSTSKNGLVCGCGGGCIQLSRKSIYREAMVASAAASRVARSSTRFPLPVSRSVDTVILVSATSECGASDDPDESENGYVGSLPVPPAVTSMTAPSHSGRKHTKAPT
jgi:hypothetical protein